MQRRNSRGLPSEDKTRPLLTAPFHNPRADLLRCLMLLAASFRMTLEQRVALMKPLSATEVFQGGRRRRQNRTGNRVEPKNYDTGKQELNLPCHWTRLGEFVQTKRHEV
jgi:hypothetical protein